MGALQGYLGAFLVASDALTAVSSEAVGTGDGTTTSFALDYGNVDLDGLRVRLDGVESTPWADYSITPNGAIVFASAPGSDAVIDADYNYAANMMPVGGFFSWGMDFSADALDSTTFATTGWRTFKAGLRGFTATAEQHWQSSPVMFDQLGTRRVARFYLHETNSDYYTAWVHVTGLNPKADVGTLVDETLSMTGDGMPSFVNL